MPVRRRRFSGLAMLVGMLVCARVPAQSLQESAPAHLAAGLNRATLDSAGGSQYWDVVVNGGSFRIVVSNDIPQQMFRPGHEPKVTFTLLPKLETAVVAQRGIPGGGTVLEGSVTQRTRVLITVQPVKSAVRESLVYTLIATGSADLGGGGSR